MSDLPAVQKERQILYRMTKENYVEAIDALTGAVVQVSNTLYPTPSAEFIDTIDEHGNKIRMQSGIPMEYRDKVSRRYHYSDVLADLICQKIIEGVPFSKIHTIEGFPDMHSLWRWKRESPDFEKKLRIAKSARAEILREEAVDVAKNASTLGDKDAVPGDKLLVETLKWAAEKDDPEVYGNKVKVEGSISSVHRLVIETGIRRVGDQGAPAIKEINVAKVDTNRPDDGEDLLSGAEEIPLECAGDDSSDSD